jgi:peptide-methionine (S)-S-oxide reductase
MKKLIIQLIIGAALLIAIALPLAAAAPHYDVATFAGGCFWCEESAFDEVPGVVKVVSGYTGGAKQHPSYEEVSDGGTGHRESVEVTYDPAKISYEKLLDIYWHNVDFKDNGGQFCDRGSQYRSAIFVHNDAQRRAAEASKAALEKRFGKVATDILPASTFWPAEEYHQQYHKKNPLRYNLYRFNCGRDARLKELWGK